MIELLVATVLVMVVTGVAYKILTNHSKQQKITVEEQKLNNAASRALDFFKNDIEKIDPRWPQMGIATVYPHMGFGLQKNFYIDSLVQPEGLNDAVTFLQTVTSKPQVYSLKNPIYWSEGAYSSNWIELNESTPGLEVGDYVLFSEPGKYMLAVVSQLQTSSNVKIRIRLLNSNEMQTTKNNASGKSSGFVTHPGMVPASLIGMQTTRRMLKMTF